MRTLLMLSAIAAVAFPIAAKCQTTEERIAALEARVRELEARLAALESPGVGAAAASHEAVRLDSRLDAGTITVDRFWQFGDISYALVSYVNDAEKTFGSVVTIECVAYGADDDELGVSTRSFNAYEYGRIYSGFEGTVEVPVELNGGKMDSMSCLITEAR